MTTTGSLSRDEARAIFLDFFSELTEERVRNRIRDAYSSDVHFNDTLKDVQGIEALEEYLVESARAVDSCTVTLEDLAISDAGYYFRWNMDIRFKRFKKGQTTRSIGMSHLRFNEEGKIAFHQDYWDSASGLFEHLPLVGAAIRWIRGRL